MSDIEIVELFISEELECRLHSFMPGPNVVEEEYITTAREAQEAAARLKASLVEARR